MDVTGTLTHRITNQIIDELNNRRLACHFFKVFRIFPFVLNNMVMLALAHDFTGKEKYLTGVIDGANYLLGVNAMGQSYVSGYGSRPLLNPHHRFWTNDLAGGFPPPPPGVVAGGPNSNPDDPTAVNAGLPGMPPAKCYIDDEGSWTTNEVTINWNAPLAWTAAFLDETSAVGQEEAAADATPEPTTAPAVEAPPTSTPEDAPDMQASYWIWVALAAGLVIVAIPLAIWLWRRRRA